eukprot:m.66359 g.66359  ORF g.66359 m.66359 type:complete len:463 (+) comp8355_c0_seq1:83-1471(+)
MNGANGKAAVGMADVRGDAHMSQAHCYLDTVKLDVGVPAEHKHIHTSSPSLQAHTTSMELATVTSHSSLHHTDRPAAWYQHAHHMPSANFVLGNKEQSDQLASGTKFHSHPGYSDVQAFVPSLVSSVPSAPSAWVDQPLDAYGNAITFASHASRPITSPRVPVTQQLSSDLHAGAASASPSSVVACAMTTSGPRLPTPQYTKMIVPNSGYAGQPNGCVMGHGGRQAPTRVRRTSGGPSAGKASTTCQSSASSPSSEQSGRRERCKTAERRAEMAAGWRAVAVMDHKDDYNCVITSNPKTRSLKQLDFLANIHSPHAKPPKGYKGETVVKIIASHSNVEAVMWDLGHAGMVIGEIVQIRSYLRQRASPQGSRTVTWKRPRHVICRQITGPADLVHDLWRTVLDRCTTYSRSSVRELCGADAHHVLRERIIDESGCFFYGPDTQHFTAFRDDWGVTVMQPTQVA